MKKNEDGIYVEDPIHIWFGLTYASYLVLPRVVMESMSLEWQEKMVNLLNEIGEKREKFVGGNYAVNLRDEDGKYIRDPLRNYRHPSMDIPQG